MTLTFTRSCLLHRFLKNEFRVLSSQTIGVEFASKIIKIGNGAGRKRMKLQLWDTAGTERFRSVSRSYYRGAAGAILVYDVSSSTSFEALPTFLMDARALASPKLTLLLAGNKQDLAADNTSEPRADDAVGSYHGGITSNVSGPSRQSSFFTSESGAGQGQGQPLLPRAFPSAANGFPTGGAPGSKQTATVAPEGRQVSTETASRWASRSNIPVAVEVSALSGDNVDELFSRLARMILTKIELGEIDPDDPQSGIQYGDMAMWGSGGGDMGSIKSVDEDGSLTRRIMGGGKNKKKRKRRSRTTGAGTWMGGMREWEDVFGIHGAGVRRRSGGGSCC